MSSRTFASADFAILSEGFIGPTIESPIGMLNTFLNGPGTWEIFGTGTNATGVNVVGSGIYRRVIQVTYDGITSPIPTDALITKVTIRTPSDFTGGADAQSILVFDVQARLTGTVCSAFPHIVKDINNIGPPNQQATVSESVSGSAADTILFDDENNPIDRATLIATFGTFTFSIPFEMRAVQPAPPNGGGSVSYSLRVTGWTITIEYTQMFRWTISQPDPPLSLVTEGDIVTLTSPVVEAPELAVDFEDITQVDILIPDYTAPGTFITVNVPTWVVISPRRLTFTMPSFGGLQPTVVRVRIQGTQFSGSVELLTPTIYFTSASGIYELIPGKTSDTLYIEAEPGETIDVKIPNPTGRTGFF